MAGSLADAFVSAGVVSKDEAEKAKKAKVKEEKDPQKPNFRPPHEPKRIERSASDTPFSKLWNDEKTHKFIVHLIHSYSPFSKGEYAWTKDQLHQKTCCICQCKLMTKQDFWDKRDEVSIVSIEHLRLRIKDELTPEQMSKDYQTIFQGKVFGVVSEDSKAAFCGQCFQDFAIWVQDMLLRGNREIHKIIRYQMVKQAIEQKDESKAENDESC